MPRKQISEKTLEINISAELLNMFRLDFPNSFIIGPTLRQESHLGYDDLIGGLPHGSYLVIQFKSPIRKFPPNTFTLNVRQHEILWEKNDRYNWGVWYFLPPFQTYKKLRAQIPNLTSKTLIKRPIDIGHLPPGKRTHRITYSSPAKLSSDVDRDIRTFNFPEFKKKIITIFRERKNSPSKAPPTIPTHQDIHKFIIDLRERRIPMRGTRFLHLGTF